MKKLWLRGVLLGVTLALLLAGGVALAQQATTVEPWCGVCCELDSFQACVQDTDNYFTLNSTGWGSLEALEVSFTSPGPTPIHATFGAMADSNGELNAYVVFHCGPIQFGGVQGFPGFGFAQEWSEEDFGEWEVLVTNHTDEAVAHLTFAADPADCQVQEEFVPEPGTIALLGSGLMGLAGYAGLRWRARR